MITLTLYVSRLFLGHLAAALLGLTALVQVFDLLKNAEQVLQRHDQSGLALIEYSALRLPEIVVYLLPLSVLMAALLALSRLAQHNEVLALKAAGLSAYKLLLGFTPAVLLVAGLHFVISDQVAPVAARALVRWDAGALGAAERAARQPPVWARSGRALVQIEEVGEEGALLRGVTLFLRSDRGRLHEQVTAREARFADGAWRLSDVRRITWPEGPPVVVREAQWDWPGALRPRQLARLATAPSNLSLRELNDVVAKPELGRHPKYFYESWRQKRVAQPFASLLMLLLAAVVAQAAPRQSRLTTNMMAGIGLGFLYLVCDGLVMTLGESGALPPALAAWAPVLIFAGIGGTALLRSEGY